MLPTRRARRRRSLRFPLSILVFVLSLWLEAALLVTFPGVIVVVQLSTTCTEVGLWVRNRRRDFWLVVFLFLAEAIDTVGVHIFIAVVVVDATDWMPFAFAFWLRGDY